MTQTFRETVIGGALIAPFVAYVIAAIAVFTVLRPLLLLVGFDRLFSHPPIAEVSLFVVILAALVAIF